MTPATSENIECYLFEKGDWVSSDLICAHFDISDRAVRRLGTSFLVSRNEGGYIHRFHATVEELEAYCGPKQAHGVTELKNVKLLRQLYRERRRPYDPAPPVHVQASLL